jgi:hypothetical protein
MANRKRRKNSNSGDWNPWMLLGLGLLTRLMPRPKFEAYWCPVNNQIMNRPGRGTDIDDCFAEHLHRPVTTEQWADVGRMPDGLSCLFCGKNHGDFGLCADLDARERSKKFWDGKVNQDA